MLERRLARCSHLGYFFSLPGRKHLDVGSKLGLDSQWRRYGHLPSYKGAQLPTRLLAAALVLVPLVVFSAAQDRTQRKSDKPLTPTRAVGEVAPAFRLNDHLGKLVKVGGKSENWTVIAFYPKAMTPG